MLEETGDRISGDIGKYKPTRGDPITFIMPVATSYYNPYNNYTFYKCSTDIKFCINTVNNIFKEYINIILSDIKENEVNPANVSNSELFIYFVFEINCDK